MNRVSVIIPAKNEELHIANCLDCIKKQYLRPVDVILVDNGSEDNTVKIAQKFIDNILIRPDINVGALRNIGVQFAKGNILAFIDADCVPSQSWLLKATEILQSQDIGAVGGPILPADKHSWVEQVWYKNIQKKQGKVNYLGSANLIIKKDVFDKVCGFNERLRSGEDRDLSWKIQSINYSTVYDESIQVTHYGYPKTLLDFAKREYWHGKAIVSDLFNLKKTKILYIIFLYIFLFLSSLIFLILKYVNFFFLAILFFLCIPLTISIYKSFSKNQMKYVFHLLVLYNIYFFCRSLSVIYLLAKSFIKNFK
jgi:glycosyltransferase involved in cell wall biosynthesis